MDDLETMVRKNNLKFDNIEILKEILEINKENIEIALFDLENHHCVCYNNDKVAFEIVRDKVQVCVEKESYRQ